MLQRVAAILQMYMQSSCDLQSLVSATLAAVLEESKCTKGLIACKTSVQEDRMCIISIQDATPLAFPGCREKSLLSWPLQPSPRDTSHDEYHSLLSIPLMFRDRLCGVVMLSNTSGMSNTELQMFLEPLVPIAASNAIGGFLSSTQVVQAHDFFMSTMSHELRTPLSGVVGMAKLLQGSSNLNADQKDYVDIIYRCGFQLLEIINDILDYSKMDTGRMQLELVPFSVRETIEAAFEVVFLKAHEKHIQLSSDIHQAVPEYIIGDRKRFRQILINLLSNAIKFTVEGKVVCRCYVSNSKLTVEIEDTGIGIQESDFDRIFQFFVQIKTSELEASEGMGLGLAICKKLTELMQGEIKVKYSKTTGMSHGTCMSLTLPLQIATTLDDKGWAELSLLTNNTSILVADTVSVRRLQLAEVLTRLPTQVVMTSSAEETIVFLKGKTFDVVFVDTDLFALLESTLKHVTGVICLGTSVNPGIPSLPFVSQTAVADCLNLILRPTRIRQQLSTKSPTSPHNITEKTMKILVVEDNDCNIKVAVEYLYKLGYTTSQVQVANNGLAAVQVCQKILFDVILMDLKMPGMDGYQASRIILDHYSKSGKPLPAILAMTAFVMNNERQKCRDAGMKGFLPKPLILQDLEIMLEVVRKKRTLQPSVNTKSKLRSPVTSGKK